MLFPDWSGKQFVSIGGYGGNTSYTTTEDSFIVGLQYKSTAYLEANDCSSLIINGQALSTTLDLNSTHQRFVYNPTPCFCCKKGTVFTTKSTQTITFLVVPLVKGGGWLESAIILLSPSKAKQRRKTHAI